MKFDLKVKNLYKSKNINPFFKIKQYYFALESIVSRSRSPSRLNASIVKNKANPGNAMSHHAEKFSLPSLIRLPQVTISGGTPIPKKLNPDSSKIAEGIPNIMAINAGEITLGKACRSSILKFL